MIINSYRFGRIVIDEIKYDSDVIVHSGELLTSWWRAEGHSVTLRDLEWVLTRNPEVLVIGQGYFGRMKVSESLVDQLVFKGIEVEISKTSLAVKEFNSLVELGRDVAGAFHLTC